MRFIKKAGCDNLEELSDVYKEFELYTSRLDFNEENRKKNLEIIKKIYKENGALITVIHVPVSKYKTSIDGENRLSTNYMSWCEIVKDEDEKKLFLSICEFAQEIIKIYKDKENEIIIIVHTGCVIGCCEQNSIFECIYQKKCYEGDIICSDENIEDQFIKQILKYDNIVIAFENITPYWNGNNKGNNKGYEYENFVLAEKLNEKNKTSIFRTVVDFCHIFATRDLLYNKDDNKDDNIEYFREYMDNISAERRKLICLFHLSKYDEKNKLHGEIFYDTQQDKEILDCIRNWCLEYSNLTPIMLEVKDSENVQSGSENFYKIMFEWSKLHVIFKDKINEDLYNFFENLYKLYSLHIDTKTKDEAIYIANHIRKYVIDESKMDKKLFDFNTDRQELDIYLLQVQCYIYYMRYCYLAKDLLNKYKDECVDISIVLKHYIFNDELEEIKTDGLGSYYNIYWIKSKHNLYHCDDGCTGGEKKETSFKEIIKNCLSHINGNYSSINYLSFSKTFGRVMMKYFDPYKNNGKITIIKGAPINCFFVKDQDENQNENLKQITIQEYQENQAGYENFSIDFSDFYNGRDGNNENESASFKELCKKSDERYSPTKVGSIYDQEVIVCNKKNLEIEEYNLTEADFIIMMIVYNIKLNNLNFGIDDIIDKTIEQIPELKNDKYELKHNRFRNNKTVGDCFESVQIQKENIKKILNSVDFDYEKEYKIDFPEQGNNGEKSGNIPFTDFTKDIIDWYKDIRSTKFYENIKEKLGEINVP